MEKLKELAEIEALKVQLHTHSDHINKLESILHVMLEELDNGTIQSSAKEILKSLGQTGDSKRAN